MVEGEVIIGCEAPEDIKHDRMHLMNIIDCVERYGRVSKIAFLQRQSPWTECRLLHLPRRTDTSYLVS